MVAARRPPPWREIVGLPNTGTGRLGLEAQLRLNGGQLWVSDSIAAQAAVTVWRPAGESAAPARAARPSAVSRLPAGVAPWWNSWAWMRCCQARRSSMRSTYVRLVSRYGES
jgi:hypothetical protein